MSDEAFGGMVLGMIFSVLLLGAITVAVLGYSVIDLKDRVKTIEQVIAK